MAKRKGNVLVNTEAQELVEVRKPVITSTSFKEVYRSTAEKVAQDTLFYRNHYYPGGKELFPFESRMHTVDKYFPYANGGPLFVDEVDGSEDKKRFEEKTKAMKKLGHRYVAILPDMKDHEILERIV